MRKTVLYIVILLSGLVNLVIAQSSTDIPFLLNAENLTDVEKFSMYVDTIDEYLYRDGKIVEQAFIACEEIIKKQTQLADSTILQYGIHKIYYEINNNNLLASYQIIKDNEYLLNNGLISDKVKGNFNYIRGYTIMTLGDVSAAQKIYYDLLEIGRGRKDTSLMVSSLYSLGQLYGDEQDYDSAINHFLSLSELKKTYKGRASTYALIDYELSTAYVESGQHDKAIDVIKSSLLYLDQEKIDRLKPDFLLLQGEIALEKRDLPTAQLIYQKVADLTIDNKDPFTKENTSFFYAKLLTQQKEFTAALAIYDSLLVQFDSMQLTNKKSALEKAHKVAYQMGKPQIAYHYLTKLYEVDEILKKQKKEQETAYLKIKFESEQKDKENQKLALEILQEHNQNRLLYFISGLFLLGLLILFFAFYQKRRYNQTLQEEVKKRTHELQVSNVELNKSNKELYQFSYICSHDLKEPILTIGTFINLMEKEIEKENPSHKYKEHFHFINKGVTNLTTLLEQIRLYLDLNNNDLLASDMISIKEVYGAVEKDLSELINHKNAVLTLNNQLASDRILSSKYGLTLVLKNLIQNGLQFNTSPQPTVHISFTQQEGHLLLSVADNGIGIDNQYFDYIFEPLKTLESKHLYDSAGLGLAICKKIILFLKGTIDVASNEDSGSVFTISFSEKVSELTTLNLASQVLIAE